MNPEVTRELHVVWLEIERLRAFIQSIEWNGATVVDWDGVTAPVCPACGGLKPGADDYGSGVHVGHMDDCALVAVLVRGQRSTPAKK